MAEMPRFAHLMILLLMGAEFTVAFSMIAALVALVARRKMPAMIAGGTAIGIVLGYAGVLLGVGLLSGEQTLAPGQWKYFCEGDCHIAYSIAGVRDESDPAAARDPVSAPGMKLVVVLKTWFDENSIASFRGNGPLAPEPRTVVLVDNAAREYLPHVAEEPATSTRSTPLTQSLRPGESYLTSLGFDVPRDAHGLRLLITDTDSASRFIIDHENSPLHGKIFLRLAEPGGALQSRLR